MFANFTKKAVLGTVSKDRKIFLNAGRVCYASQGAIIEGEDEEITKLFADNDKKTYTLEQYTDQYLVSGDNKLKNENTKLKRSINSLKAEITNLKNKSDDKLEKK